MKLKKGMAGFSRICSMGSVFLLLAAFSVTASAADEGYTMSLRPSSDVVNPGDIIQLAVQVRNDGWPDTGEAEVAAFQATLDYDHNSLEYLSVDIPEGTMGDFNADSSIVLGYGEGHAFQETFDCAVLTMKVSESAGGDIPVNINNVILAKQDATELKAAAADPLILKVGGDAAEGTVSASSGESVASSSGNGVPASSGESVTSSSRGDGATGANKGADGSRSGSDQSGSNGKAASGSKNAAKNGVTANNSGSSGKQKNNSASGTSEGNGDASKAAGEKKTSSEAVSGDSADSANDDTVNTGAASGIKTEENRAAGSGKVIAGLVALAAVGAAAAGAWVYRKRR